MVIPRIRLCSLVTFAVVLAVASMAGGETLARLRPEQFRDDLGELGLDEQGTIVCCLAYALRKDEPGLLALLAEGGRVLEKTDLDSREQNGLAQALSSATKAENPVRNSRDLLRLDLVVREVFDDALEAIDGMPGVDVCYTRLVEAGIQPTTIGHCLIAYVEYVERLRQHATRIRDRLFDPVDKLTREVEEDLVDRVELAQELYDSGIVIPDFYEEVASKLERLPRQSRLFLDLGDSNRVSSASGQDKYQRLRELTEKHAERIYDLQRFEIKLRRAALVQRQRDAFERTHATRREMAIEAAEVGVLPDSYRRTKGFEFEEEGALTNQLERSDLLFKRVGSSLRSSVTLDGTDDAVKALKARLQEKYGVRLILDELTEGNLESLTCNELPLREVLLIASGGTEPVVGAGFVVGKTLREGEVAAADEPITAVYRLRHGFHFHANDWGSAESATLPGKTKPVPGSETDDDSIKVLLNRPTDLAGTQRWKSDEKESTNSNYLADVIHAFTEIDRTNIIWDNNSHTLILKGSPRQLTEAEEILAYIDVAAPQVFIEARFMEVSVSDLREAGLEWLLESDAALTKKSTQDGGTVERVPQTVVREGASITPAIFSTGAGADFPFSPRGPGATPFAAVTTQDKGLNFVFDGILTQPDFRAVLHAIEISGKGRTLSVPRVTTANNHPAKLRHGQDFPFYKRYDSTNLLELIDSEGNEHWVSTLVPRTNSQSSEKIGITLTAVPSVGADRKTISLLLHSTISDFDRFTAYGTVRMGYENESLLVRLPVFSKREIATKVVVESGETVVLGGLIDTVEQESVSKVPLLSSIPLLGSLFRRTDQTESRLNLLIFVTATVISESGESLVARDRLAH